ncbi:MAG: hypothetical protein ACRD2W_22300 [Acidimicrobiales bacterium]
MVEQKLQQLFMGSFEFFARRAMARLDGLTDDEYFWEPVAGCWTVRRDPASGRMDVDRALPAPEPPPVTTIAWRIVHICSFL